MLVCLQQFILKDHFFLLTQTVESNYILLKSYVLYVVCMSSIVYNWKYIKCHY
jgi:hypothetical protein